MKNLILTIATFIVYVGVNAQLVSTSRLNPISENPDTTQTTSGTTTTSNTTEEVNSGSKKIVVTPVQSEATKKEENSSEPVNNPGVKNPK